MSFPCSSCGLCCKHISGIEELKEFDLGNGVCKHLNIITNECDIYENRPLVCRVDEMFEKVFFREFKTRKEFYEANALICNKLQIDNDLDEKFRIKID